VAKGGTVIVLAHTNKNMRDGKPVYGGTSDVVDDFDCAYTVADGPSEDPREKVVLFENIKRRGHVARRAGYAFSVQDGIGYDELLSSVRRVDPDDLRSIAQVAEVATDAHVISAVEACIREGINTKMLVARTVAERAGVSRRDALRVIEKYTGTDPMAHRWSYSVHARGAKVFVLLDAAQPVPGEGPPSG
jgi:hypothetical protein